MFRIAESVTRDLDARSEYVCSEFIYTAVSLAEISTYL